MIINYEEVFIKATKRWVEDGKKRQETRKFFQTINPFNKDEGGNIKGRQQIMGEISKEADDWLRENKDD